MNDKKSPLVDYEPSEGENDRNEPSQAEIEKDAERKERVRRNSEKIPAITGDPVVRRTPSPISHQGPKRQSSDGSTPFRRIDAPVVVADKIGPKP